MVSLDTAADLLYESIQHLPGARYIGLADGYLILYTGAQWRDEVPKEWHGYPVVHKTMGPLVARGSY